MKIYSEVFLATTLSIDLGRDYIWEIFKSYDLRLYQTKTMDELETRRRDS